MGWGEMLCKTPGEGLVLHGMQSRPFGREYWDVPLPRFHHLCELKPHREAGAEHHRPGRARAGPQVSSWDELASQRVFSSPSIRLCRAGISSSEANRSPPHAGWLMSLLAGAVVTESGAACDCRLCGAAIGAARGEEPPRPCKARGSDLKQNCPPDLSGWFHQNVLGDEAKSLPACPGNSRSLPALAGVFSLKF